MKLLLTSFFVFMFTFVYADPQTFTGNMTVIPGSTETYTITWNNWGGVYNNYANVSWTITGGTVVSSNKTEVTIEWGPVDAWESSAQGVINVTEDLGGQEGTCYVTLKNFEEGVIEECNQVLGPPAVFINFGAGPNPGPALPAGTITYRYNPSCAIFSGQYTRTNTTVSCRSQWIGIPEDHTPGDVNGYMLMVDGDANSGEVYRTTVAGLTQSFRYEFSAFLANLSPDPPYQKPRIQFEIYDLANNLVRSSGSYPIDYEPSNPWKKISFMFDLTGVGSSVRIVIRNVNNKSDGNDFVIDDLSFAPCYTPVIASFSNSSIIDKSYTCNNGTVNLFATWPTSIIPFTNPSFVWQRNNGNPDVWINIPGGTSQSFTVSQSTPGIYKYRVLSRESSNPGGLLLISNEIKYFVQKMVVDAKTYNVFNCVPSPIILAPSYRLQFSDPDAAANFSYSWSPGTYLNSTIIEKPTITLPTLAPAAINAPNSAPPINRIYNLTVNNTNYVGCVATGVQTVAQYNPRKVAIPNAFSPYSTQGNNLFRPLNIQDYPGSEFWIYNRWGNQVFYSQGPTLANYSWNGKYGNTIELGVYTWRVDIKGAGCSTNILTSVGYNNTTNNPFGTVTLVR